MMSDTHGKHDEIYRVPEGDVLIHAGDVSNVGKPSEIKAFAEWFQSQPHKYKCWVGGNHDWGLQHFLEYGNEFMVRDMSSSAYYLRDSDVTLDGVKFYGSPWQPTFCDWAFNLPRGRWLAEKWDMIPVDTDVLITHGPPYGILDKVGQEHVGCADLRTRVDFIKPKIHCFGHIHCAAGMTELNGTTFVNAALLSERYGLVNAPTVVDI